MAFCRCVRLSQLSYSVTCYNWYDGNEKSVHSWCGHSSKIGRFGLVCAFVESTATDQPPTATSSKSLSLSCVRQLLRASRILNTDSKIVVRSVSRIRIPSKFKTITHFAWMYRYSTKVPLHCRTLCCLEFNYTTRPNWIFVRLSMSSKSRSNLRNVRIFPLLNGRPLAIEI